MNWEDNLNDAERQNLQMLRSWIAGWETYIANTRRLINALRKRANKRAERQKEKTQ